MRKCSSSWIDTYMEYTKEQESPKVFNLMTGFTVLSAAIGRNVKLPRIKYTIYPNIYTILIAESAKCRKSVSVNIGRKLLMKMQEPPMIFAQKITPEALIEAITEGKKADYSYGLIFSDELSVFLSSDAIKRGLIPVLTSFYDSHDEWTYHTKGRGKQVIRNSSLSMLAATTREDFLTIMPQSSIGGGFTSRLVLAYAERPSKLKLFNPESESGHEVEETTQEKVLKERLVGDLDYISSKVKGVLRFSPAAKKKSMEWYESEQDIIRPPGTDGYYGRKHDTMFKLAGILAISEGDDLIIGVDHIDRALEVLDVVESHSTPLIEQIGKSESGTITEKILDLIYRHGEIDHTLLLRKVWRFANAQELAVITRTLLESGEIKERVEGSKRTYYRPKKVL